MDYKVLINGGKVIHVPLTQKELDQREQDRLIREEQDLLDSLKPSQEEIETAERQLNLINDLSELGVL